MSCEDVREILSAYLDGELSGARREELRSHLASCGGCTRAYELLREVSERSRAVFHLEADSLGDLKETEARVVAVSTLALRSAEGGRARRRPWLMLSVVVALLAAIPWVVVAVVSHLRDGTPAPLRGDCPPFTALTRAGGFVRLVLEDPPGLDLVTDGAGRFRLRPWMPLPALPRPSAGAQASAWCGGDARVLWTFDPTTDTVRHVPSDGPRPLLDRVRDDLSLWSLPGVRTGATVSALRALALLRGPGRDPGKWREGAPREGAETIELTVPEPPSGNPVTVRLVLPDHGGGPVALEFGAWSFRVSSPALPGWHDLIGEATRVEPEVSGR